MFGLIPDSPTGRDHVPNALRLVGGIDRIRPVELNYVEHVGEVMDQGPTNSCVANYLSSALLIASIIAGRPMPRPSRRWLYDVARYRRTPGVLIDEGSVIRLMCEGAAENGIVAESSFEFDPAKINERPPFDLDVAGQSAKFTGFYNIEGGGGGIGGDLISLIETALVKGHIPGFAMHVYENFVDMPHTHGYSYDHVSGLFKGNHMLGIVGYTDEDFILLNSWGSSWGDGGLCRIRKGLVATDLCFEHTAITAEAA